MKAIVFAAGLGSRLKPFTDSHPKALAPIGDTPILGLVIRRLVAASAGGIIVNVHHFSGQIIEYLQANDFGVPVEISDESLQLLDTAGGIARIFRQCDMMRPLKDDEPVIVHNADILTDFPLDEMIAEHRSSRADATVLVDSSRISARSFLFDNNMRLCGWQNKAKGIIRPEGLDAAGLKAASFGGVHILSGRIIQAISDTFGHEIVPKGITDFYIDNCRYFNIHGYTPSAPYRWFDIGTPEKLEIARKEYEHIK